MRGEAPLRTAPASLVSVAVDPAAHPLSLYAEAMEGSPSGAGRRLESFVGFTTAMLVSPGRTLSFTTLSAEEVRGEWLRISGEEVAMADLWEARATVLREMREEVG